jgi:AraC family transcriptional regulator
MKPTAALSLSLMPGVDPEGRSRVHGPRVTTRDFDEKAFAEAVVALRIVHGVGCPPRAPDQAKGGLTSRHYHVALAGIERQVGRAISVAELARACGLSTNHFARAFRKTHGVSPRAWLILRRIERAQALLVGSDLSLADIALECGFCEQSHFSRQFAKVVGVTPGAWRRTVRVEPLRMQDGCKTAPVAT